MSSERSLSTEMVFLLLQFLKEEKYDETVHKLEKESGVFFNMRYFESLVTNGEWEKVEEYLSGFIKVDENQYSLKLMFEIRKQKYLEALDNQDFANAAEILRKDLKVFSAFNEDLYKEMALLLCQQNFRENSKLSSYCDTESARRIVLVEVKKLIQENPVFRDKLQFPNLKNSRLRTLLNQSLNWQHALCKNAKPFPDIKTMFADHNCEEPDGVKGQSISANPGPPQHDPAPSDISSVESNSYSSCTVDEDLPKTVVANLSHSSAVKSMDFHPLQQTVLVVGTNTGDIYVWEVGTRERLAWKPFQAQNLGNSIVMQQASLVTKYTATASVNRVRWSADGCFLGVAYSKHIVHLYAYTSGDDLNNHLLIDAHVGSVNDLAFSHLSKHLCVITCGDDKKIKVWNAATGAKQYTLEGHEAPVYSVYPYYKNNIPFLYSTAIDGKIKIWFYDEVGRVEIDAPGHACMTMAYSSDGTRLFSCGTSKKGVSHLVEWNEREGIVKRIYLGLGKYSVDIVQFDMIKNRFLAVGDECSVKYWDMNNVNLMGTVDADGGLELSPCIRFNKYGTLLAVSAAGNGVKILANTEGSKLTCSTENHAGPIFPAQTTSTVSADGTSSNTVDMDGPENADSIVNRDGKNLSKTADNFTISATCNMTEITEQSQLVSLKLPDRLLSVKVIRLMYTSTGNCILALTDNAVHKLWKWQQNERNVTGQATASLLPQLWQPRSGLLMTNDLKESKLEEAVPCLALSKNDSYVVSASGGTISLFNIQTFQMMATFMPPQPAATCVVFHPEDNNVVAVGMEDSSIRIYNVRLNQVIRTLMGHRKRVTGLAFSSVLGILLSSAADAQLHVWSVNGWKKKAGKCLQIRPGYATEPLAQTRVQFHKEQIHVLVVHESKIAIYVAPRLDRINQWVVGQSSVTMTDATYSCDGKSVYASFKDGSVNVFIASGLALMCRINATSYLPSTTPSLTVYPLVIAAHPCKANQFAIGLSDGGVYVLEPLEKLGNWGTCAY